MRKLIDSRSFRIALWETYGQCCAYCDDPVPFGAMEVDHIVPQGWRTLPTNERDERYSKIGIASDFDLDSALNLYPSCSRCNLKKRDSQLPGAMPIYLKVAQSKSKRVLARQEQIERDWTSERAKTSLALSIETGSLTIDDATAILVENGTRLKDLKLSSSFPLFGEGGLTNLNPDDYEQYLDTALILPDWMPEGLDLISPNGNLIHVKTLREYQQAKKNGSEPTCNAGSKTAYSYFDRPIQLLDIAKDSKPAAQSYIRSPLKGLADIDLLPSSLLSFLFEDSESTSKPLNQSTIGDLVRADKVTIRHVSSDMVSFRHDDNWTYMVELMRADTNNDGIEELVIHWGGGPLHGTMSLGEVKILKKASATGTFSEI